MGYLDGVHGGDGHGGGGHAGKDMAGDLEEAHDECAMEGGFAGTFDTESGQQLFPPEDAGWGGCEQDLEPGTLVGEWGREGLTDGAEEDAIEGHDAELDERKGNGIPKPGQDVFAGVVADGRGSIPEATEGSIAEHVGSG